jgi:hypothetical protein
VDGRPEDYFTGRIIKVLTSGQQHLPSAALGLHAGGDLPVEPEEQVRGAETEQRATASDKPQFRAVEPFFEVQVAPSPNAAKYLRPGQRVVARFSLPASPLASQGWRALLQLLQRRFKI